MSVIPQATIEEIRALTDIVDVVADYVQLKKRGSNFVGLCPFHSEKTPSFNVNPSMAIYKCFGCGAGGDVFSFVGEMEGLSFPETVRLLGERVGVVIPEDEALSDESNETEAVYFALRFAARFFFSNLTKAPEAERARTYLSERGVDADTVRTFGLGYAPPGWDELLHAARESHVNESILEKAGLVIPRKKGQGYYDRYRDRIIFPIVSHVGKVMGFGGRIVNPDDEPKYINSPETAVYSKSRVLYGLHQARQEIRASEEAVLVEGYTDVIALHRAGVQNVVATCGTALTRDQILLLGRYARQIVVLYDADKAGVRAAYRAIELILENGMTVYTISLPPDEDPDSFIRREGVKAFESILKNERRNFIDFILQQSRLSGNMDTPENESRVQRTILRTIGKIPDPLLREGYLKLASATLGIPDMQLRSVLQSLSKDRSRTRYFESTGQKSISGSHGVSMKRETGVPPGQDESQDVKPEERALLGLMLVHGISFVEFIMSHMAMSEFSGGAARTMATHLVSMYESGQMDRDAFVRGDFGDNMQRLASGLLTTEIEPSQNWGRLRNISVPELNEDPREAAISAMVFLKLDHVDQAISERKERVLQAENAGEDVRELQQEIMALHRTRRDIKDRKFISDV